MSFNWSRDSIQTILPQPYSFPVFHIHCHPWVSLAWDPVTIYKSCNVSSASTLYEIVCFVGKMEEAKIQFQTNLQDEHGESIMVGRNILYAYLTNKNIIWRTPFLLRRQTYLGPRAITEFKIFYVYSLIVGSRYPTTISLFLLIWITIQRLSSHPFHSWIAFLEGTKCPFP